MRKSVQLIGAIIFWISWPFFRVYLNGTKRTRLLLICKDEFLVVTGWLGTDWSLPGGGLHRGENTTKGALRELREETGIALKGSQLIHLLDGHSEVHHLPYDYTVYYCVVDEKPTIHKQMLEISGYEWRSFDNLKNIEPNTRYILSQWIASH